VTGPTCPPSSATWRRLDPDLLTPYLLGKGERLALAEYRVQFCRDAWWPTRVSFPFIVGGDTGGPYQVWLQPYRPDGWWAHCSRGGDHDLMPEHGVCGHEVAAAIDLATNILPGLAGRGEAALALLKEATR